MAMKACMRHTTHTTDKLTLVLSELISGYINQHLRGLHQLSYVCRVGATIRYNTYTCMSA